ncbi:MAG TPA: CDP-alcohol phosphatidyltransferase family protein [Euryarchaeota archaeon]|nr:CDP-diacylglycerol--inositol 3-phosphatidyltransferase [archaeon BMS3Bbin15]HDL14913.1 CDP-alcohol phosphatidyltransferase family protein [Euryarchaeota archaeon]
MLSSNFRGIANSIIIPIAKIFAFLRISPSLITIMGFVASVIAALSFYTGNLSLALVFLILAGFFDVMDGAVARLLNRISDFGAFFDSVLDRYSDAAVLIGLTLYLHAYLLGMFALAGSFMVSYTRARAEHFIPKCDVGLGERAERLIILIVALAAAVMGLYPAEKMLYYGFVLLTLIAFSTAIERFTYTYFVMRKSDEK